MIFHDQYARLTPFEMAFPEGRDLEELAEEVKREAQARGGELQDRGAFMMLTSVASRVRTLQGSEETPEGFVEYGALLYHAFHFQEAGHPLFLLGTHAARYLVGGGPAAERVEAPSPSGYVQLPRNLFWIPGVREADAAEPVDGFFWHQGSDGVLRLLVAAGIREGRPGMRGVPIPEAPLEDAPGWLDAAMRPEGADFATTLPGGEMEGLYSLLSAGEVLKLAARLFVYLARVPECLEAGVPGAASPGGGAPSALPFTRIGLHG